MKVQLTLGAQAKLKSYDIKEMTEPKKRRTRAFKCLALKSVLDNLEVSRYKALCLVEDILSPYIYLIGTISISVSL